MNDENSASELDKVSEIWISFFLIALVIGTGAFFLLASYSTLLPHTGHYSYFKTSICAMLDLRARMPNQNVSAARGSETPATIARECPTRLGSAKTKSVIKATKVGPAPSATKLKMKKNMAVTVARNRLGVINCNAADPMGIGIV